MRGHQITRAQVFTRWHAVRFGLAAGTGWAMRAMVPQSSLGQATPVIAPPSENVYPRPEMLIDARSLKERLDDPSLVTAGLMPSEEFDTNHIPGSVQIDWPALEVIDTSDDSIASWREQVGQTLAEIGVTPNRTVVAYDPGTLFAARLWWVLHYLGHEDKHVLNGGVEAWRQADGEVETGTANVGSGGTPESGRYDMTPRTEVLAQREEVKASLGDPGVVLVDARTPQEYASGHIPGAVNVNFPRNAQPEGPTFWKSAEELRAIYAEVGATPEKRIIPYCSSGVRSAVTFFTLSLIGYEDVALYTGSWQEWSAHPELPKVSGNRP